MHKRGLILLDFECAHRGDAAFDLGFFLSHLIMKTIHASPRDRALASRYTELAPRFWIAYLERRSLGRGCRS